MKELSALIASTKGRAVAFFTAFVMGGLTQFLTSKGFEMPGETAIAISGAVAAVSGWAIDAIAARTATKGIKEIQNALPGVSPTGQVNAGTMASVERLVQRSGLDPNASTEPLTLTEAARLKARFYDIVRNNPTVLAELRQGYAEILDRDETET